ncbi:MAG: transglutaminase-like cysteine peptidase [Euryhalocaulis sp.]|uniref:transglutaminase-like cysteine peptidase n=1 Tax=Euryhalocaulis sp. TaxID=2744307 RepID=UPI00181FFE45|nr:transglutaminase-like cysteine peptidase [Euryhalocaulis sp.]MBA4802338.1 transglutaminase-like cysteine peptidase [Euryhalocaulis sp.]
MRQRVQRSNRGLKFGQLAALLCLSMTAACKTMDGSTAMQLAGPAEAPRGLLTFCEKRPEICQSEMGARESAPALETATGGQGRGMTAEHPWFKPGATAKIKFHDAAVEQPVPPAHPWFKPELPAALAAAENTGFMTLGLALPESKGLSPAPVKAAETPAARVSETVEATPELFELLEQVNRDINDRLRWVADEDRYGVDELWLMPLTFGLGVEGDCEDFALEKRKALIDAGLPRGALALAMGYSESAGHHAVLMVRTTAGDFVLDNTTPWINGWANSGYRWIAVQASADILDWRMAQQQAG